MSSKSTLFLVAASLMFVAACASRPHDSEPLPDATAHGLTLKNALPSHAIDLSKPLSADALAAIAIYTNPDLQALRASMGVAEAQVFAAGLYPDPVFSLSFDRPLNGTGLVSALGAGLGYDFAALARRPSTLQGARANRDKVRHDIAWAEWLTGEQARLATTRIVHLREIKAQTNWLRSMADDELSRALRASLRGDLAAAALETRRIATTDAADRDRTAELQLKGAELDLNRVLGIDPAESLLLALPILIVSSPPDSETLYLQAISTRADLAGLRSGYAMAKSQTTGARLGRFPLPAIGLNAARDTGKINTFGPNFSFSLPFWNKGRGDTAIALANEGQLRAEYTARLESIRADIASAYSGVQIITEQHNDIKRKIAPLIKQIDATQRAALRGDISESTAQTAQMTLLDKQITAAGLALALAELEIALEVLVGRSMESIE